VVKDETDEDEEEDSNVCTIHTIADLQHVLKSQEDIQVSLWNVNCWKVAPMLYSNNTRISNLLFLGFEYCSNL